MEYLKEKTYSGFMFSVEGHYVGLSVLENGTWLMVRDDATAVDQNGKKYVRVSKEVAAGCFPIDGTDRLYYPPDVEPPEVMDTDLETIGWSCEADRPIIIPLHEQ